MWVEPASAAGLAGLAHELGQGKIDLRSRRVVAVCTGHGLKDPDIVARSMPPPRVLDAEMEALESEIIK